MVLLVILAALGAQRYLHFSSADYSLQWLDRYVAWVAAKTESWGKQHPMVGLAILVLPISMAISLLLASFRPGMGGLTYLLLVTLLLWYWLDARVWPNYGDQDPTALLTRAYEKIFALIFWFAVMGPLGLMVYVVVTSIVKHVTLPEAEKACLMNPAKQCLAYFDWIPVRLLGLTFGLVGHFAAVLHLWFPSLTKKPEVDNTSLEAWAQAALQVGAGKKLLVADLTALLDRALLVWLVVLALFSVGSWIG